MPNPRGLPYNVLVFIHPRQAVDRKQAEEFAKKHGVQMVEASAKSGDNVDDGFMKLAREVKKRLIDVNPDSSVCVRLGCDATHIMDMPTHD